MTDQRVLISSCALDSHMGDPIDTSQMLAVLISSSQNKAKATMHLRNIQGKNGREKTAKISSTLILKAILH